MVKDILARYVWLVDTINRAGNEGITFEEMDRKWQLSESLSYGEPYSKRSFHRHRLEIEELFGIIIDCHPGTYQYFIEDRDELKDAHGFKKWLLETITLSNLVSESQNLRENILVEDVPSSGLFLTRIIEAIRDERKIRFRYQQFSTDVPYLNDNQCPYALKCSGRRWYMLSKRPDGKLRIYALDRMKSVELTDVKYHIPDSFDADAYFKDYYGVFVTSDPLPQDIRIKVAESQAKYIRTLPLHHSQKEVESDGEFAQFSYYVAPTYDFVQKLLTLREDFEVLEPKSLRKEIARIGEIITKNNKK